MADYYDTGTVSVLSGNRTVTGTGTSWANLIRAGDMLEIGGRQMRIASVESATSLTLKLPAPTAASGAYAIWYSASSRTSGLQALEDMRRQIEIGEILMAMRGDYAVRAAPLNAPPSAPVTGDMYIVGTAPSGAWVGYAGYLARWTGTGWSYTAPTPGTRAYVTGAGINWQRGETAWGVVPGQVSALAVSGSLVDATGIIPEGCLPDNLRPVATMGGQSHILLPASVAGVRAIIKTGVVFSSSANGNVVFNLAFPTACRAIVTAVQPASSVWTAANVAQTVAIQNMTTTGFDFRFGGITSSGGWSSTGANIHWQAIGN